MSTTITILATGRDSPLYRHLTAALERAADTGYADLRRARDADIHDAAARWASGERPDDETANAVGGWA